MKITKRINLALNTAAKAHVRQFRKGSDTPYIVHPVAVASIVSDYTDDEDTIIAALFHDTIEDVSDVYSESQMSDDFGDRVVVIVKHVSEDKVDEYGSVKTWVERKTDYHNHLANLKDNSALLVTCADKIHNMMSMISDYDIIGENLWEKFSGSKYEQLWNYKTNINILKTKNIPGKMLDQLTALLATLESIIKRQY